MKPPRTAALLALVAATVAAYAGSLRAPFFFDDRINIVANPVIQSLASFTSLSRLVDTATYSANMKYAVAVRPFAYFTFALNQAVSGAKPFGYHLVNLAIHLVGVLLVFALTRALLTTPAFAARRATPDGEPSLFEGWAPFLAAALFACHPLQTQAVTYVTQRFASLAAVLYLGSVHCHVRGRLGERPGLRVVALVLAFLALLTKEIAATLPVTLLLVEVVFLGSTPRAAFRRVWPYLATVAVIPALMLYAARHTGTGSFQSFVARGQNVAPAFEYFLTQTTVIPMYLAKALWPANLNFDYDWPLYRSLAEPRVLSGLALLVILVASAAWLVFRGRRTGSPPMAMVGFGVVWFFVAMAVESSFVPIADLAEEYRFYLPSVGLAWAVVFAALSAVARRPPVAHRAMVAALAAAAVLLGVATHLRNEVFRDEVTLWEDTVAKSPLKARPHTNLSVAYSLAGREEDSILEYQAAAFLNPEFRRTHGRLGVRQDEFERMMHGAAAQFVQRHIAQGIAAVEMGNVAEGEKEFRAALRLDPDNVEAHSNLGYVHVTRREFDAAVRENREAVRLAPGRSDVLRNLGLALAWSGRTTDAVEVFRRALALDPADSESRRLLEELDGQK